MAQHPFALGADISWVTEMESRGQQFYNAQGEERECTALMKELGLNACISWVDTPNEYLTHQSPQFHEHLGYRKCAHFHQCGYKFGRWFDMIWMEKIIGEHKEQ